MPMRTVSSQRIGRTRVLTQAENHRFVKTTDDVLKPTRQFERTALQCALSCNVLPWLQPFQYPRATKTSRSRRYPRSHVCSIAKVASQLSLLDGYHHQSTYVADRAGTRALARAHTHTRARPPACPCTLA